MVYGSETVLPIEVEIQSLRVLVETKVLEEDWAKARYEQLALIDEKSARGNTMHKGTKKGLLEFKWSKTTDLIFFLKKREDDKIIFQTSFTESCLQN